MTRPIPFGASAAEVQSALTGLSTIGGVTVADHKIGVDTFNILGVSRIWSVRFQS